MNKSSLCLLVTLLFALCLNVMAADGPSPTEKPGPRKSGFYDFWQVPPGESSGVGSLPGTADCFIGPATQPAVYAGNFLLDCDGETPHNETTIVVNPNNPSHAVGGFHSYRLFFNGATVGQRVVAAASTTFDGGATWHEVIPPVTPYQFTGDPARLPPEPASTVVPQTARCGQWLRRYKDPRHAWATTPAFPRHHWLQYGST